MQTCVCPLCVPQAGLSERHLQVEQDVSELVNRARGEGVDRMIQLRKKYGCSGRDDDGLAVTRSKVQ